jgi:hypothetical protein
MQTDPTQWKKKSVEELTVQEHETMSDWVSGIGCGCECARARVCVCVCWRRAESHKAPHSLTSHSLPPPSLSLSRAAAPLPHQVPGRGRADGRGQPEHGRLAAGAGHPAAGQARRGGQLGCVFAICLGSCTKSPVLNTQDPSLPLRLPKPVPCTQGRVPAARGAAAPLSSPPLSSRPPPPPRAAPARGPSRRRRGRRGASSCPWPAAPRCSARPAAR